MKASEPMNISPAQMERLLTRAYAKTAKIPERYPTVQYLDRLIYGEDWHEDMDRMIHSKEWEKWPFFTTKNERAETFAYMVRHLLYGFDRDSVWHRENPGKEDPTLSNLYDYITIPAKSTREPHVGIWQAADRQRMEDIQAAFEYMQGFLLDGDYFTISRPSHASHYAVNTR